MTATTNFSEQMFSPMDSAHSMLWDTTFDEQIMVDYNQQSPELYNSLESASVSSPSSDGSSSSARKRRTTSCTTEVRRAIPDKVERRREQNRQSQRAYRDRKETRQRDLEGQITAWKEKHEELTKSYTTQTEKVFQLKAQIQDLNSRIESLQSGLPEVWGQTDHTHQEFDLVPFYNKKTGVWSRDEIIS